MWITRLSHAPLCLFLKWYFLCIRAHLRLGELQPISGLKFSFMVRAEGLEPPWLFRPPRSERGAATITPCPHTGHSSSYSFRCLTPQIKLWNSLIWLLVGHEGFEPSRAFNRRVYSALHSSTLATSQVEFMVGVRGLEPLASAFRTPRSTKLSYTPKSWHPSKMPIWSMVLCGRQELNLHRISPTSTSS
jgi:hypothetical protein